MSSPVSEGAETAPQDEQAPQSESTTDDAEQTDAKPSKPSETVDFWKAKAREQERRAKANADAAKKLAEIEDANKSEAQKTADKIAALQAEAEQARAEVLRFKIAAKHGITDEDADLFLTGTDEDTLTKQAQRLAKRDEDAGKPRPPKPDPNQGRTRNGAASTADQFATAVQGLL